MSTISSEYFGHNSGRYSAANQPGKYKGFGVVDFQAGTVGDNYEPYPMASGQLTGGAPTAGTTVLPFVKPAGKIYKFMQPKVTMPAMVTQRDIVYPAPAVYPAPKKASTHKRKSGKRGVSSKRHTKKSTHKRR